MGRGQDKEFNARLMVAMGPRFKSARKARGLTQKTVAKRVGIAKNFYARIECGRGSPSVRNLIKIADTLDVSVDDLLGIEESDPTPEIKSTPLSPRIQYIVDRARDDPELIRVIIKLIECSEGPDRERDDA